MLKKLLDRSRSLFGAGVLAVLLTIAIAAIVFSPGVSEKGRWGSLWGAAEEISVKDLPPEARAKLAAIKAGGPFEYKDDGLVFRNRQKKLPIKRRGYYRLYIVPTPGVKGTGKRRIVAGLGKKGSVATSGEYWYTSDDYEVLHRIRE
ncbi:ribonuclease [Mesosutterella sp. OilRF-GAM-744-9]|uniref:Ribonuclease n=2 Tax=Mesosutterella TaxID=2494213 RepID=A0ABS9MS04_9BURK|nr:MULTISPECIES: ribonuclease domain-containing protein [unclassified Mesosutterella]MCG5031307.1 ribonuclease [Mesosutterella sp. oilRF-744-WT-GAM-9]MCI6530625.1 ribonuclease [Mesosutterella sp.]MDL2058593.1 ribonuclease domain-containing protein [Mesosutterella sp. AGMB02718]